MDLLIEAIQETEKQRFQEFLLEGKLDLTKFHLHRYKFMKTPLDIWTLCQCFAKSETYTQLAYFYAQALGVPNLTSPDQLARVRSNAHNLKRHIHQMQLIKLWQEFSNTKDGEKLLEGEGKRGKPTISPIKSDKKEEGGGDLLLKKHALLRKKQKLQKALEKTQVCMDGIDKVLHTHINS